MRKMEFKKRNIDFEVAEKVYSINVSNADFIRKAQEKINDLSTVQAKFMADEKAGKVPDLDELIGAAETAVNLLLNDDWPRLWEAMDHDLHNMYDLMIGLAEIVAEGGKYEKRGFTTRGKVS